MGKKEAIDEIRKQQHEEFIKTGIIKVENKELENTYLGTLTQGELKEIDNVRYILGRAFEDIKGLLHEYMDMRDDYYDLMALWIIGTYLHDSFETFPYLFINAMRGAGKSRAMKLIASLSYKGTLNTSMREAVLFRMGKRTLCIDEFEQIVSKEAQALREILNASYKKGMKIARMKKQGEEFVLEEFEPYKPIVMANIWGMEEVLGDRCVTLILEKSSDPRRTRLNEDFENNVIVGVVKNNISLCLVQLCSFFSKSGVLKKWNNYINSRYKYIPTYTTLTTNTTQTTGDFTDDKLQDVDLLHMFNRIHDTGINGRNLELMLPFFLISDFLSEDIFSKMLKIAIDMTKERKESEMTESRDVMLIDFVSKFEKPDYITIKKLTVDFRSFIGDDETEEKWINPRWVGRALKRLNLIRDKRRMHGGVEVIPNVKKAIEQMRMFTTQ